MKTVVLFLAPKDEASDLSAPKRRNKLYTRSLRTFGFIDNRHPKDGPYPKKWEHWLVEVVRENLTDSGGCFILRPIRKIEQAEQTPLLIGMYDIKVDEDAVLIVPRDQTKCWVMSTSAKQAIMESSPGARAMVIDHGGPMWPRRKPAEDVLEQAARRLLTETDGEPEVPG